MEKHEFVIVGAGPAGLKAGELLAKARKDVLILDKKKAEDLGNKLCAGAMSPKIYSSIPQEIVEQPIYRVNIYSKAFKRLVLETERPSSKMISRAALAEWQLDQALNVGANLNDNEKITKIDMKNKILTTDKGKEYKYEKLIGADGSHSLIRKELGLHVKDTFVCFQWTLKNKGHEEDASFWFNVTDYGYSGMYLFPHGDTIKLGGGGPYVRGPLKDYIDATKKFFEKRELDLVNNEEYGIDTINLSYSGHRFKDVTLLGDAAGFPEPMLGEGMAYAMYSAELEFKDGEGAKGKRRDELERYLFTNKKLANTYINKPYKSLQNFTFVRKVPDKVVDKTCSGDNLLYKIFKFGVDHIWMKGRY
jgi:flavin-dependent dehydrogenase